MSNQGFFMSALRGAFLDARGRLRSGWRLAVFVVAFLVVGFQLLLLFRLALSFALAGTTAEADRLLDTAAGYIVQSVVMLVAAILVGWACGHWLDKLRLDELRLDELRTDGVRPDDVRTDGLRHGSPAWRALGWTRHRGWLRDLLLGSCLGAASLILATLLASATGGLRFTLAPAADLAPVARTLCVSAFIFILAAAAEEAAFRGYPLQTLLRSLPAWAAVVPSSLLFASIHLLNPNVVRGFTFVNTVLAGIWLAVAYLRTRSLWFALGLHWSWNWTMGALLGLPVSGITQVAPAPLLRAADLGPAWLTGGHYGLEGGLACTLALVISTLFVARTRLVEEGHKEKGKRQKEEQPKQQQLKEEEQPLAHLEGD